MPASRATTTPMCMTFRRSWAAAWAVSRAGWAGWFCRFRSVVLRGVVCGAWRRGWRGVPDDQPTRSLQSSSSPRPACLAHAANCTGPIP